MGNLKFSEGAIVIEMAGIKVPCTSEVCFACVGAKARRGLHSRLCQGKPSRCMIQAKEVNLVVRPAEQAISFEECRIACDSFGEHIDRREQNRFATFSTCPHQKIFGAY